MRVLFYGGCHGTVLSGIFGRFVLGGKFSCSNIVNYELIAQQDRFPFEILGNFDAVVYNPILNKGMHNTSNLVAECAKRRIKMVCYPWLQWNGYHPRAMKMKLYGNEFYYPEIVRAAYDIDNLERFRRWSIEEFLLKEWIENIEESTRRLMEYENGADVSVSNFIVKNFRKIRLFNTPDHPSTFLYQHVADQIAQHLGLKLDPSFFDLSLEFQGDVVTPILPKVADTLELEFKGSELRNRSGLGDRSFGLNEWLDMIWYGVRHPGLTMAWPLYGSALTDAMGAAYSVPQGKMIFVEKIDSGRYRIHDGRPLKAGVYRALDPYWHETTLEAPQI